MFAGACALAAYAPELAAACGAPEPGLTSTTPADGATYPANAALLFNGFDISLDAVTVTVDGAPATLVPAGFVSGFADFEVAIEPQPTPGQTVVVSGSFCPDWSCPETSLTFTAGEPDLSAPVPVPEAAFFGVFDHADFMSSGGDCLFDSDMTFYLHTEQSAADGAPQRIYAEWQPQGPGGFWGTALTDGTSATLRMSITANNLADADPTRDVCFTVSVADAAGNKAEPYTVCPACFFRKDEAEVDDPTPSEPAWTEADAVPGSPCAGEAGTTGDATTGDPTTGDVTTTDDPTGGPEPTGTGTGEPETSSATGGDQDDDGKGCACDSDGGGGPGGLAVAALALALVRRRSRNMS